MLRKQPHQRFVRDIHLQQGGDKRANQQKRDRLHQDPDKDHLNALNGRIQIRVPGNLRQEEKDDGRQDGDLQLADFLPFARLFYLLRIKNLRQVFFC